MVLIWKNKSLELRFLFLYIALKLNILGHANVLAGEE